MKPWMPLCGTLFALLISALLLVAGCPAGDDDDTTGDDDATADDDTTGDDDTSPPTGCYEDCEAILAGYQACGGNLLGTWEVVQFCGAPHEFAILGGDCPEEDQHRAFFALDGTVTFDKKTFTNDAWELGFVYMTDISTSCIPNPYSCENLPTDLQATLGLESGECVDTGASCECLLCSGTMPATSSEAHDYSLNGSTIIEDEQDAGTYCVDGDTLTLHMYAGSEFEHVLILSRK